MSRRLNLLICLHSGSMSGAQRCINIFLESLDRTRYDVAVTLPSAGPVSEWMEDRAIPAFITPTVWIASSERNRNRQWLRFTRGLSHRVKLYSDVIRQRKPDVVISNTSVLLEPALAAAIRGVPHVTHVLELTDHDDDLTPIFSATGNAAIIGALSQKIIAVSNVVAQYMSKAVTSDRIEVINTGLSLEAPQCDVQAVRHAIGLTDADEVILYAGLLSFRKGVTELAEAMNRVVRSRPNALLVVAGRDIGAQRAMLEKLEANTRTRVRLLGHRNDVLQLMLASDLVVVPSRADPLPVTVLEAMNLSRAIVATRSGGCEDLLDDGESGKLVPPRDAGALADGIIELLQTPNLRMRIGGNARARVRKRFSPEVHRDRFCAALEECTQINRNAGESTAVEALVDLVSHSAALIKPRDAMHLLEDTIRNYARHYRGLIH